MEMSASMCQAWIRADRLAPEFGEVHRSLSGHGSMQRRVQQRTDHHQSLSADRADGLVGCEAEPSLSEPRQHRLAFPGIQNLRRGQGEWPGQVRKGALKKARSSAIPLVLHRCQVRQ